MWGNILSHVGVHHTIAPVEKRMHTNGFRYKKCTHLTVGTGNVYLNPG